MKVRAAVLERVGGPIEVQELELGEPRKGEVLVRMLATGVCHSDWHLVTGDTRHPLPVVLGHEGAGVVQGLGSGVHGLGEGDLVALNWAPSCGKCFYCSHGRPALCGEYVGPVWAGTMLDGSTRFSRGGSPVYHYSALACFSEYIVVPSVCCVRMPGGVPAEVAAVIGCAVTTGVGSVLNTARVAAGSSVCVIGAGGVGLSTVMGAVVAGASQIIVCDPLESRREAALQIGTGARASLQGESGGSTKATLAHGTHTLPSADPKSVKELTEGRGADYVFECVGTPALQEVAVECARPGGTVVFSGLSPNGSSTNIPGARLVREEKTVMGSYYGTSNPAVDFPRYAAMYQEGTLPLDRLVSHRYPLDQINQAYADMLAGVGSRGVVLFDGVS
jgi:S-(hydroxymethyl)glutathione dehydrogenase/alcohol dehydrogenase